MADLYADPKDLRIVGLDLLEGQAGYQEDLIDPDRIDSPMEGLVDSVCLFGVREAVSVRTVRVGKSDRIHVVINGRQRVMAARLAAARLKKAVRVPYVVREGDELSVVLANEFQRNDPPWVKGRTIKRLQGFGHSWDEIAASFCDGQKIPSRQTLDNWVRLTALAPEILDQIKAGTIPVTVGYELGKLPKAEQLAKVKTVTEGGGSFKGESGMANAKAPPPAPVPVRAPDPKPSPGKALIEAGKALKSPAVIARGEELEREAAKPAPVKPIRFVGLAKVQALASAYIVADDSTDEERVAGAVFSFLLGDSEPAEEYPMLLKGMRRVVE